MSWTPVVNIYDPDINYGDVYLLNYFGILVFFSVCDVGVETVKLVELDSHSYEDGFMLYDDLRLSKHPYFVKKNVRTKSDYEITVEEGAEGFLPIYVGYENKICEKVRIPITGIFYAEKITNYRNIYFINEEECVEA